jgi:hypothetical protein
MPLGTPVLVECPVIKLRYIGVHAEGLTEIIDAGTGEVVLKAVLNPEERQVKA